MAETIKGINVAIGSDTTGLSKALSDVNKKSRDIQSELRQVEKLLKLDPTNTELLAQKQTLLTNAVENTKEKLDRLKSAQEQVNEQFERGQINEGQYRAFQREIAATEQQLRRYEERISDTNNSLNNLGETAENNAEKLNNVSEKLKGVGQTMSVGVTAPIVAAGGLMLKGAIDAENAQGKLQASLGLTTEAAAELEAVAQAVWVNGFGETIDVVTEAIGSVRTNMGNLADDDMQKVTEGAMTIADIFGADVADSTKVAGTMMKNFGISSQEALDLITVGFQKGGDFSGELLDTLNEYSPQFSTMGTSAHQMLGILISGAQAGAFNLDKVGDAVKEFNIRAQDGSKTTAEGFQAIGLNAEHMGAAIAQGGEKGQQAFTATIAALAAIKDPIQQNTAGTALFGTQWEDVRSKVIVAMADGVKGIGDFKGATEDATKATHDNNPGIALTKAMRELQMAIGPALLPLADIIKNAIAPAIKSLADWFTNLSPAGQKTVLAIIGIVAAIGPLLTILSPMITIIGSIVGAIGAMSAAIAGGATGIAILTTAFPALGAVMAVIASPIGIVIAAIAGLIAIGVLLYKNWDAIKAKASEIWDGIKLYLENLWTNIKTTATTAWGDFKAWIIDHFNKIIQGAKDIWNGLIEWFRELPQKLYNIAVDMFNYMKNGVVNTVTNVKDAIVAGITSAINWITSLPGKMLEYGKNIIQGLIDGIKSMIYRVTNVVSDLAEGIKEKIRGALRINSPSKVMMELGAGVGLGLAQGMSNTVSEVSRQAESLASAAVPTMSHAYLNNSIKGTGTTSGNSYSYGALLSADKIVIANDMDIQELAHKLGFYWKQTVLAKGG